MCAQMSGLSTPKAASVEKKPTAVNEQVGKRSRQVTSVTSTYGTRSLTRAHAAIYDRLWRKKAQWTFGVNVCVLGDGEKLRP